MRTKGHNAMTPETQRLLYEDETGELEGVFEVQLMDPIPVDRLLPVRALIGGSDLVAWSHALRVLLGWGDEAGLVEAERFLESDKNPFEGIDTHRLFGTDLTYDNLASALSIGFSINGLPKGRVIALANRLLALSEKVFFLNGLEDLVTKINDRSLLEATEHAVNRLAEDGQLRKGTDLLPALATMDPERAMRAIELFREPDGLTNLTAVGVARTLARIHTPASRRELEEIAGRDDLPGANDVASEALDSWDDS